MLYQIYLLIDPGRGEVFYVGCTTKPTRRLVDHIKAKSTGGNGQKIKARIAEMAQQGIKPTMAVIETTEDRSRERFWIRHLRSLNTALLNVCIPGGNPDRQARARQAARLAGRKRKHLYGRIAGDRRGKGRGRARR